MVSGGKEEHKEQEEHIRARDSDQMEPPPLRSQNGSASEESRSRATQKPPTRGKRKNGAAPEFELTPTPPKIDVGAKFDEFMQVYPRRKGSNPRKTASDKFCKAV